MTHKQLGYISWYILRNIEDKLDQHRETKVNRTLEVAENWCKENLDVGTASDIIGLWKDDHKDIAINQLRHLGLKIKE